VRKIDEFVDSVYQNLNGDIKDIQDLKAEMKSHLLESVHELKSQGYSEKDAIKCAIERFGNRNEIRYMIGQLFRIQKNFAKSVLYTAIGVLVFSIILFGILLTNSEANMEKQAETATEIRKIIANDSVVSKHKRNMINELMQDTNHISEIKLYAIDNIEEDVFDYIETAKPDYHFKQEVWAPNWLNPKFYPYGNGDERWFIEMETRSFDALSIIVLFSGLSIYWSLFAIWAIINAYHQNRLNIKWVIIFSIFNILGIALFKLSKPGNFK
jgi:hypothetical protein